MSGWRTFDRGMMMRMICSNCGYIYDPAAGDPLNGIAPGVGFEALPEGWVCPLCYADKAVFDPME